MKEVIIDNTALNHFSNLNEQMERRWGKRSFDIFALLNNVYQKVHIPLEIKNEFARGMVSNFAARVLRRIERGDTFLVLCQSLDEIVFSELKTRGIKDIHQGEAEMIAQAQQIRVRFFITDDKRCVKALEILGESFSFIRCFSSLTVLTMLDIQEQLPHRELVFQSFFQVYQKPPKGRSTTFMMRAAFIDAACFWGISLDKKELKRRCKF